MSGTTRRFTVRADHLQFYLEDAQADPSVTASIWDKRSVADMITAGPGVVGVGTPSNFRDVPVTVRVLGSEPGEEEDLHRWDHVAQAGLSLPSGCLLVRGPTQPRPGWERIALEPGGYGVRVYYANLGSVSRNGLEGEDSYEVALWPSEHEWEPRVLKRSEQSAERPS